ncbi:acetyltransferase [Vibrio anguillarum]|nr:acetyltransferase [Vibrio anguillarum]
MFTVCFLSSAMRCQPLSRALCVLIKNILYMFIYTVVVCMLRI